MTPDISFGVIFDQVQWGLPIGPFRLAPRADIRQRPFYEGTRYLNVAPSEKGEASCSDHADRSKAQAHQMPSDATRG